MDLLTIIKPRVALQMQRKQTAKPYSIRQLAKQKQISVRSQSPLKPQQQRRRKKDVTKVRLNRDVGSKQSCNKCLPLRNFEIKQKLLQEMAGKQRGIYNNSLLESGNSCSRQLHPNRQYFGSDNSIQLHLEYSKHSRGSKNSKGSTTKSIKSSKSNSSQAIIQQKMRAYRNLEAKHYIQIEKMAMKSPLAVKRLQKIHSMQRLQVMEELAKVVRRV